MFEEAAVQAGAKSLVLPDSEQSGILALECSIPPRTVVRHLRSEGILANVRGGRLRVSPHAYHAVEDVDRFATTLKKIL